MPNCRCLLVDSLPIPFAVTPELLPVLRLHTLGQCLCVQCGVHIGEVRIYRIDKVGLGATCRICLDNLTYASNGDPVGLLSRAWEDWTR